MSNQKPTLGKKITMLVVGALIAFSVWYVVKYYRLDTAFPIKIDHLTEQRPHFKR